MESCVTQIMTSRLPAQVINDYGPLSQAELLRRFGFVETNVNPHACCQLSFASLLEAAKTNASEARGGHRDRPHTTCSSRAHENTAGVAMVPTCFEPC